jgi:uncharacterized membrane protein YgdD (TMEM256/DUF423 family)
MIPHRFHALLATVLGATGVLAGAFAAHALRDAVAPADLAIWETAARYQLLHAVALLVIALQPQPQWRLPATLMAAGILVFSGSLYLLVLTGTRWLGAVTPIGGVLLVVGWSAAGWVIWQRGKS